MEFLAVAITHPSPELIIQLHLVTPQMPITLVLPKRTHVSSHEKYLWIALMAVRSGSMISPTGGRGNGRKERWCNSPRITYLEGQPLCCSASFRFQALHWDQRAGIPWAGPICMVSSVQFSYSVASNSLQPHESQHASPPCPSPSPRIYSKSCPSSQWCHPAISSSVVPFSSCPQSFPASGSFPMSQLFKWGGQSIRVSALA